MFHLLIHSLMTIPGGPLAKTPDSHARGLGSILGEETRSDMPHEVVTKATDLLTRQSETRHQREWTADLTVSAGRLRCPAARKERKAAPSSCPSPEDLGKGASPQD